MIVVERRRGVLWGAMALSVVLHVVGVGSLFLFGSLGGGMSNPAMSNEQLIVPVEREDELRLGLDEAESASIDWLGVLEPEPVVGEAVISEVDQAEQAVVVGEREEVVSEEVPIEEAMEVVANERVFEPVEERVEPVEELIEQVAVPIEEIEALVEKGIVVAEVVEEMVGEVQEKEVVVSEVAVPSQAQERVDKTNSVQAGTKGVLSKQEVVATRIERAIEIDPHKLNVPVPGKGMEILTARPRYTTAVRLSAVPKNPIVVMWFDASGKVSKAEFVRDGKKLYSSGIVGVDEPLLSAIYTWRAKGKEIDALDVDDPKSLVEVTIKIVYQKERKGSSE